MFDTLVEIVTPGLVPGYGEDEFDWDTPASVEPVPFGVEVQPASRVEDDDGGKRVFVQSGFRLICPPGCFLEVEPTQRVRVPGVGDCDVVGDRADWWHTTHGHTSLQLEVARG